MIPVTIANYSEKPLRNVRVYRWLNDERSNWGHPEMLGPMAPMESVTAEIMAGKEDEIGPIAVAVVFEDAGGRIWRRWERGELEELQRDADEAAGVRSEAGQRVIPDYATTRNIEWNRESVRRRLGP